MSRRIAEVLWEDAWVECEDCPDIRVPTLEPVQRRTAGFLIAENTKCIVLSTDVYENNPKIVNTVMVIPWSVVLDRWVYE